MIRFRDGILALCIVITLLAPMLPVGFLGHEIMNASSFPPTREKSADRNAEQVEPVERDEHLQDSLVISLDGDTVESIPGFVTQDSDSRSVSPSQTPFIFADADPLKPNITAVHYQNITAGNDEWVTWMQPGSTIKIWFKVKGPIYISGPVVLLRFTQVISESTNWGAALGEGSMNIVDIEANQTQWFTWQFTLPNEATGNYGWGPGKVNAFSLLLYQPFLVVPPQLYEEFYNGLNDKSSYLHMFGEVRVNKLEWHNYTYDAPSPDWIPCRIAERNWAVFPEFEYYVVNAPVWDIQLRADLRRDIVFWPDETLIPYDATTIAQLSPGSYSYHPFYMGSWMGWLLEEPWEYGSLIGQTRGLYMKFHLYSGASWSELYSSNDAGELLRLLDKIMEQSPQIEILTPLDGEVIAQSTVSLKAFISDPNSNYQVDQVLLYVDDVPMTVTHLYDPLTGLFERDVTIPVSTGAVNITLTASDSDGLIGRDTTIVISDSPLAYFPSIYTSSYQHIDRVLASQIFEWTFPLTYSPNPDFNITLTPTVEIGFSTSIGFDVYYSRPAQVSAGDNYSTYVSVTDPVISCSMWITFDVGYNITLLNSGISGSKTVFNETWIASRTIPLGIEVLDLRYDLPGISEHIRRFTHYRISFLDMIPVLGNFASLDLIVDIVPRFKIENVIIADIAGVNCVPDRDEITFVSGRMFAITSTVDIAAGGSLAEVLLNDVILESTVGLDMAVNLTLTGEVLLFPVADVDMNQWLYDNLGIQVPSLSLWNSKAIIPLTSQIALVSNVVSQQLDIRMTGISADEEFINVELRLQDERGNGVVSSTVSASVDGLSCTVNEIGDGEYVALVPYRSTQFILSVTFVKSGYIGGIDEFDIYIDPLIVDSTPPSIGALSISPENPEGEDSVIVSASMIDTLTGVVDPTLYYSIDTGQSWYTVTMTLVSGTTYRGTIPAQPAGTNVLYYIRVMDGAGNEDATSQQTYTVNWDASTTTTGTTITETTGTTTETSTSDEPPSIPDTLGPTLILASLGTVAVIVILVILVKKR